MVGALRIGGVALPAGDRERPRETSAPADLQRVAHALDACGFADDAAVELFAPRLGPLQELFGAIDARAFLVAGDQERNCALGLAVIDRGGDETSDRSLHVHGAAAVEHAVLDLAGQRWGRTPTLGA